MARTPKARLLALLALLPLAGLSACGGDTEPPPAIDAQIPEFDSEAMALVMEAQEIQERLAVVGEEAMQDPELRDELENLRTRIDEAVRAEAPELVASMEEFRTEYAEAQAAGDQEALARIEAEAEEVQAALERVQREVLERPEIAGSIEAFETAQRDRMEEIDPEAGALMDRLEEIERALGMG
jgi:hypothetical protein